MGELARFGYTEDDLYSPDYQFTEEIEAARALLWDK
jgi:hypothetical protein